MNQNETASPPLCPHARAARRLRGRPSGLNGRCRARCATGLRPALDPGASAAPDAQTVRGRARGALPRHTARRSAPTIKINPYKSSLYGSRGLPPAIIMGG
jgi:hypothetical protein